MPRLAICKAENGDVLPPPLRSRVAHLGRGGLPLRWGCEGKGSANVPTLVQPLDSEPGHTGAGRTISTTVVGRKRMQLLREASECRRKQMISAKRAGSVMCASPIFIVPRVRHQLRRGAYTREPVGRPRHGPCLRKARAGPARGLRGTLGRHGTCAESPALLGRARRGGTPCHRRLKAVPQKLRRSRRHVGRRSARICCRRESADSFDRPVTWSVSVSVNGRVVYRACGGG